MISHDGPESIFWINEGGQKFNSDEYIDFLSDNFILD